MSDTSRPSSRVNFESDPLVEHRDRSGDIDAAAIEGNFFRMTFFFAANHGCTVSCLDLANARLGSIGVWQSGALYASYTLSALYGASYFVKRFGSRNSLILGMGMSAGYVASFFAISLIQGEEGQLRDLVALASAVVGGVGASILWVAQGAYFTSAARLYAAVGGGTTEDATSQFGGSFAFLLLLLEVVLRLLSSFFIETAGFSWEVIFALYSILSILPVFLMVGVIDLEGYQNDSIRLLSTDDGSDEEFNQEYFSPSLKAMATLNLLRNDTKAPLLSPLNILFGLSTSFCSSVLNGAVIRQALDDPNSSFVGLFTALSSTVAAGASLLFGTLQSSPRFHCTKGTVIMLGIMCYLSIALLFIAIPNGHDWNGLSLILVYTLLGTARATYEGTLRAVFADFFPREKEGAFGNIVLFSGTASTLGYVLSVTGALECKEVNKHCVEYNDSSVHNVFVMELAIIATAAVAIPAYWRAAWIFRAETFQRNNDNI